MTLHVNNAGSFIEPDEVFVKDGGVWRTIKETHVKDSGTWRKIFPVAGNQTFDVAGTTSFVVPQGVYTLSVPAISGGGGGGPSGYHSGDCHSGVPGAAGIAALNLSFAVTPGETLTVTVGAGGAGGTPWVFQAPQRIGGVGGITTVKRGATTIYSYAGGGANSGYYYSGSNFFSPGYTNATGTYGTGGYGGACANDGGAGVAGVVKFTWT